MKTSTAFRLTKQHLSHGGDGFDPASPNAQRYVCLAASKAGITVGAIVKPIIGALIAPHITLEDWMKTNLSPEGRIAKRTPYLDSHWQTTRHAWVDHLIKHYKSIGD